jgi:hypothetical protein
LSYTNHRSSALQAGSATFYVTEPAALSAAPQLLQRLKAAGALPIVLAKVLHDAEQLQLAVALDPRHLTRNIKAQACVHMFNVYSEQAAGSLTYFHQVGMRCDQPNFTSMRLLWRTVACCLPKLSAWHTQHDKALAFTDLVLVLLCLAHTA